MNSLYTLGLRQTSAISADLEKFKAGDSSAALQGQISASLAALNRTLDDYDSMARREIIKLKQEKAYMRISKFRTDYTELKGQFDQAKLQASNAREAASRADLFTSSATPTATSFSRQRIPQSFGTPSVDSHSENPFANAAQPTLSGRQAHALDEHSFIHETENQLDAFIAQGREVLDNLVDQRGVLKGTQRRLLDAANTIGLSREVIGWVERRSKEDTIIFFVGAVFTFICFYLIWHWFG